MTDKALSPSFEDGAPADFAAMAARARQASELLKALAHEGRLLILCQLCSGEKSVSELEESLGQPQSAVSQQLARLRLDRLVTARRDGRAIYYSLARPEAKAVIGALYSAFCGKSA